MEDLLKNLGPKKKVSPLEKNAKLDALKAMKKSAGDVIGDEYADHLNKVTVAAKDKAGLEEGLDKAKDVLGEMKDEPKEEESAEEALESPDDEIDEVLENVDSPEKIDEMMKKLMAKKLELEAKG